MDKEIRKQLSPLYELIGSVVQSSQQMEMSITYTITLLRRLNSKVFSDEDFDNSMEMLSKNTLGKLIIELKKYLTIDEISINSIKIALEERNYIIHRFFNENIENFLTPSGRQLCVDRIKEARIKIHPGYIALDNITQLLMNLNGINSTDIFSEVESKIVK